jgi:hypothetical protein
VQAIGRQPKRAPDGAPAHDESHQPQHSTLYRLVQQHAAGFIVHTKASKGAELLRFVEDEFDAWPVIEKVLTHLGSIPNRRPGARHAWPDTRSRPEPRPPSKRHVMGRRATPQQGWRCAPCPCRVPQLRANPRV